MRPKNSMSPSDQARSPAQDALCSATRGWPGAALAVGPDGVILSASSMSGLCEGMKAPFEPPPTPLAAQMTDTAGRRWRISQDVDGMRFATADLRESPDAARRFTAAVSHEIRTPLNGILGMIELIEEGDLSAAQREYAAAIRKSGARLLDLLNNVLDYSRLEAGDIPLDEGPFDPSDLVQDVAELLSHRAHASGLDIAAIVDPNLPRTMIGDSGRLRQILFNLTGNAVKFTPAGAVLIEAASGPDGRGLSLIVRDTGVGVPANARARLFEAFGQVSAADAGRDGGVGLGLAIVARLVTAMKGEISLVSQVGAGAMFRVDLPLKAAVGEGDRKPSSPRVVRPPSVAVSLPPSSAMACLTALAEDGARWVDVEEDGATDADLIIVDAANPPARIEALARRRPTLVVMRPQDRALIGQFRDMGCAGYLIRPLRASSVLERARLAIGGDVQAVASGDPAVRAGAGQVLIADDNAVNALLAKSALSAAGYRVDVAGTGAEALERASALAYSVIFMDIRMPVMNGIEATRRIRRLPGAAGETPIIALTADLSPDVEDSARDAGVSAIAAKPIDPPRLRQLAERWARASAGVAG